MGTSRNGRCESLPWAWDSGNTHTSMGTSRNGRCEPSEGSAGSPGGEALQWGPPGMGGVSGVDMATAAGIASLQWGPPGMGGVRRTGLRSPGISISYFNGDLPEWEV